MERFVSDSDLKVLPEFVGSIDNKYLNLKVKNHK
jgi:hypothetical protein